MMPHCEWSSSRFMLCITCIALLTQGMAISQPSPSDFSRLRQIEVDSTLKVFVYYNPYQSKVLDQVVNTGTECCYTLNVVKSKLSPSLPDTFLVQYTSGPSDDPGFLFFREQGDSLVQLGYVINGLKLYAPGNGYVYISGHTDNMFDTRKKYLVTKDSVKEVPQPFYYVGLASKATEAIRIYTDFTQTNEVAVIAKGSPVTVVLNHGDYYLLKTPFGLTGWLRIPFPSPDAQPPIEGLYFAGD